MVSEGTKIAVGKLMGDAMAKQQEFDFWWAFQNRSKHACASCGRWYGDPGWLRRHYEKTGHWRTLESALDADARRT